MLAVLFQRGVPSPVLLWTVPFLGRELSSEVCVRARACVVFGACTPLGSLKVGNTLSFPGPPPSGLGPARQGRRERESPVPAGRSASGFSVQQGRC